MKKLPMVLCILLTCAVIFSSLFLPEAAFSLIDQNEGKKTDTEQAAAISEEVPQDDKLFMLARALDYSVQNTSRSSDFFLKSGKEIEEKELFDIIQREMALLDPYDSLGFTTNLKMSGNKKQLSPTLMNVVQFDSGAKAFPVWLVNVNTNGMTYQLTLDAIIGRIFSVNIYRSPGETADTDAASGNEEYNRLLIEPAIQPELLAQYAEYLHYDASEPAWLQYEMTGIEGFICTPETTKFSLAYYSTGYDWVLSPVF